MTKPGTRRALRLAAPGPGEPDPEREEVREQERALRDDLLSGSQGGAARFVDAFAGAMLAALRRPLGRSRREDEAEDLLQSLWEELLRDDARALRRWDPGRGRSLKNYLRVLAGYRALSHLRGKVTVVLDDAILDEAVEVAHPALLSPERRVHLDRAVQRYLHERPEDAAFFQRAFLEEDSPEELAAAFGMTLAAVYARRYRMRKRLLELLEEVAQ